MQEVVVNLNDLNLVATRMVNVSVGSGAVEAGATLQL
jgi:hypothetical protein